jgi:hypothetical protein
MGQGHFIYIQTSPMGNLNSLELIPFFIDISVCQTFTIPCAGLVGYYSVVNP